MVNARQEQIKKNEILSKIAQDNAYKSIKVPNIEIKGASQGRSTNHLSKYLNP